MPKVDTEEGRDRPEVVLDTCVVAVISRTPKSPPADTLSSAVKKKKFRVCADLAGGLVGEWEETANAEVVRQLIVYWEQHPGWKLGDPQVFPQHVSKKLTALGFTQTIDRLIVRIAMGTSEKKVVTNDSDFWDPKNKKSAGDHKAPVSRV